MKGTSLTIFTVVTLKTCRVPLSAGLRIPRAQLGLIILRPYVVRKPTTANLAGDVFHTCECNYVELVTHCVGFLH